MLILLFLSHLVPNSYQENLPDLPSKYIQNPASVYHLHYYHLGLRHVIAYMCYCTSLFTGLPVSLCLLTVYLNTGVRKKLLERKSDCVPSSISFQEKAHGLTIIYRTLQNLASLPTFVTSLPFPSYLLTLLQSHESPWNSLTVQVKLCR